MYFSSFALMAATIVGLVFPMGRVDSLTLVKEKSEITFVGKKNDGSHSGGFKAFKVDCQADFGDPSKSSLNIDIDADSLFSDNEMLTNHLKNPDFFDVRKYPTITFESTSIEPVNEREATIVGKLKMLDKSVEVKVPVKVSVSDSTVELKAEFKIDRTDWGMTYGEGKIEKEVQVTAIMTFKR